MLCLPGLRRKEAGAGVLKGSGVKEVLRHLGVLGVPLPLCQHEGGPWKWLH